MDIAGLIQHYGYAAVCAGAFFEGEAVVLAAGFAAHRGYLELPLVITIAALAGCAGDVFFFALGRRFGRPVLRRFPALEARFARADALIQRHSTWFILVLRFMYGLRTAGALALGMSQVRWSSFLILNFCGAWLWATTVSIAGYVLGEALERLLADLGRYEHWVIGVLIAAGAAIWLAQRARSRRAAASSRSPT